jgi:outer membrane receptor protein involved in Fe transport
MVVRLTEPVALAAILCLAAAPAAAQQAVSFNIPGGRLSDALIALGRQGGITIGASDPGLAAIRSRPVRGRMPVRAALARLLAGTGYDFSFVGPGAVRIVRAAPVRRPPPPRPRPAPVAPPPPAQDQPQPDIIVTASKQGVALDRFGGTVHVVDLSDAQAGRFGARGSDAVLERLPMLASTSLGPGRDKIYIRGVADSSFNGPSQSIVGQTLGDVRLTFNAPDPDLQLYDMERVELLEGPQGTLYGTGALGGILRLVPNPPNLTEPGGSMAAGLLTTRHGNPGGDLAGVVNLPVIPGRLAVRAVGYGSVDGGYIDDAGRGLRDVNRTKTWGGRAALLLDAGDGWRLELGGVAQYIAGRDGQYAMRGLPPLTRSTSLAQPFDNDYQLGQFTLRKRWSGVELVSATGIVRHALETRFDATGFPGTSGPQLYTENVGITLVSNETRLSEPNARGEGWVVGWSLLHDISRIRRRLGPPDATLPIAGVRNEVTEAALFGQYSLGLTDRLTGTLGGRLTWSRTTGEPLDAAPGSAEPSRTDFRVSPTAAITWRPGGGVLLYGRFQQGFRAGGLAVSASGAGGPVQRFESDSLTSYEAGIRFGQAGRDRVSVDASVSYARWADIQADLIDARGLPFTTNIGDGRIFGLEIDASWRATPSLSLDLAAFLTSSALSSPAPAFASANERDLPNIADAGARAAVHYRTVLSTAMTLRVDGAARYVGHSQLGIGPPVDIRQGGYIDTQLGARLDFGRFGLSLDVDNVADARGNRFSFGNPFTVGDRTQTTPLRPRTVRIGLDAAF